MKSVITKYNLNAIFFLLSKEGVANCLVSYREHKEIQFHKRTVQTYVVLCCGWVQLLKINWIHLLSLSAHTCSLCTSLGRVNMSSTAKRKGVALVAHEWCLGVAPSIPL